MSTKTEPENATTSGAEKLLAVVLAVFILIGAIWSYDQIGQISGDDGNYGYQVFRDAKRDLAPADRAAIKVQTRARREVSGAERSVRRKKARVGFTGEAYRTELAAGRLAPAQLAAYRNAQAKLVAARVELGQARDRQAAARPAARRAEKVLRANEAGLRSAHRNDERIVFLLRLVLVAAMLGGGYLWLASARRNRSRLLPLALAEIVAATGLAFYMAGDYGSDWGVFDEVGPLLISVIGIVLTIGAFIALQRYLAKRIPLRRVRKDECPFCGYPARGEPQCEGCGRRIVGECSTCHEPRRVATPHCGRCGAA